MKGIVVGEFGGGGGDYVVTGRMITRCGAQAHKEAGGRRCGNMKA